MSNPSPKSPSDVAKDSDYEVMRDSLGGSYWPSADEMIVKHKATETFWRAVYSVGADDSDYALSATWKQVCPEPVTRMKYVEVQS